MYQYLWDKETHGFILSPEANGIIKPIRPVFFEELDMLGFNQYWSYPQCKEPLLWAEGARRYLVDGELVAETKGGGFYTTPSVEVYQKELQLTPINIELMTKKNALVSAGLEQKAISFVYEEWKKYKSSVDFIYVAYSGGKDSAVMFDLVYRALSIHDYHVIFSDTGMELSDTYENIKNLDNYYPGIELKVASSMESSKLSPKETWELAGPPARRQRWCCSIHKSAPGLLKIRELIKANSAKALVFEGVRGDESEKRSTYEAAAEGVKHATQVNIRPIFDWNVAEVFNYLFTHDIKINNAYRKGLTRVGCAICPMASGWRDYVTNKNYHDEIEPFLENIEQYASAVCANANDVKQYVEDGRWISRVGGNNIYNAQSRVQESYDGKTLTLTAQGNLSQFRQWIKAVGRISWQGDDNGEIVSSVSKIKYRILCKRNQNGFETSFYPIDIIHDRTTAKFIRMAVSKSCYCIGCRVCEAECEYGALKINREKIEIGDQKCRHCLKCFSIDKGCLVAKSLYVTKEANRVKSIDRYKGFGMKHEWLALFFERRQNFWSNGLLGVKQYDGFRFWLKDAGIINTSDLSPFGMMFLEAGAESRLFWALTWCNLAYNAPIANWYCLHVAPGSYVDKGEIMENMGSATAERTKTNALNALWSTLQNSYLGEELGQGVPEKRKAKVYMYRKGWLDAEPLAILYALYLFAEHEEGRYSFTLEQLDNCEANDSGLTPQQIFAIDTSTLRAIILGLSKDYPDYIQADMAMGLDNIRLSDAKSCQDVLALYRA